MHGSHDGDVSDFGALQMYNRAYPVTPTLNTKGFVFVYGANHGQWNSRWETCCESTLPPLPFPRIAWRMRSRLERPTLMRFSVLVFQGNFSYKHFLQRRRRFRQFARCDPRISVSGSATNFHRSLSGGQRYGNTSLSGATNSASASFSSHTNLSFAQDDAPDFLWGETNGLLLKWQGNNDPKVQDKCCRPVEYIA